MLYKAFCSLYHTDNKGITNMELRKLNFSKFSNLANVEIYLKDKFTFQIIYRNKNY